MTCKENEYDNYKHNTQALAFIGNRSIYQSFDGYARNKFSEGNLNGWFQSYSHI